MKRKITRFATLFGMFAIVFSIGLGVALDSAYGSEGGGGEELVEGEEAIADAKTPVSPWQGPFIVIGATLAIGASCLGAGYAVGKVGSAAFGAISERPELVTRALLFVALAEGIAIYGLVVAVMLIMRL